MIYPDQTKLFYCLTVSRSEQLSGCFPLAQLLHIYIVCGQFFRPYFEQSLVLASRKGNVDRSIILLQAELHLPRCFPFAQLLDIYIECGQFFRPYFKQRLVSASGAANFQMLANNWLQLNIECG